jgi:hypothetical protein
VQTGRTSSRSRSWRWSRARPAIEPGGEAAAGSIDATPLEFPLVTQTQHAGDVDELGEPWPVTTLESAPDSPSLDDVILKRGSTRLMDASASVARKVFDFAMAASLRGHACAALGRRARGRRGWRRGCTAGPASTRRCAAATCARSCCAPAGIRTSAATPAFVVMAATDLDALDDRGYREAQLDAGLVEGRLHIAAYALGIGASGMTFLDSEIEPLLGDGLAGLIFTCVGVPTYRSKGGGKPGAPTSVVIPEAGLTLPSGETMDA